MKRYRNVVIACGALYFLAVLIFAVLTLNVGEDTDREALVLKLNEIAYKVETDRVDTGNMDYAQYGWERYCIVPCPLRTEGFPLKRRSKRDIRTVIFL